MTLIIILLFVNTVLLALIAYAMIQMAARFQRSARSLESRLDRLERVVLPAVESLRNILATIEGGIAKTVSAQETASGVRTLVALLEWLKVVGVLDFIRSILSRLWRHKESEPARERERDRLRRD